MIIALVQEVQELLCLRAKKSAKNTHATRIIRTKKRSLF